MDNNTYEIIKLVLELVITAITIYIVPVVKAWLVNTQLDKKAASLVAAAYQILSDDPQYNEAKKDYAINGIKAFAKTLGRELTDEQAVGLIEAAYAIFKKETLKK